MQFPRGVAILGLLIGFAGLVRGLLLLDRDPLLAVLGLLAAMAVLLGSLARICSNDGDERVRSMEDRSTF
jgi:hypothetical protein